MENNYLITLKNDKNRSYMVNNVHEIKTCSENVYFRDAERKIVAVVDKSEILIIMNYK